MHYTPAKEVVAPGRARLRLVGFVCAATLQIAMIWALVNGLDIKGIQDLVKPIETFFPKDQAKPQTPPPAEPQQQRPDQVFVPWPDLPPIDAGAPRDTGLTIDTRPTPQPTSGPVDHGPVSLMATHTIPPYPALDVRLGNEGTVLLRLTVGPDGRVIDARVVRTSGFESLDRAAQAWVVSHWRYQPAFRGGGAAASAVDVAVKFSLKNTG